MQWDPYEENLLVACSDSKICLISFNGLDNRTCVKQRFDSTSAIQTNLFWTSDKSGNFVTSSEKFGVVTIWNAASTEPRKILKVGASGIQNILPMKNQVAIAFKNGAIMVYNLKKQRVDFQTESGHSETIFDLDYHRKK